MSNTTPSETLDTPPKIPLWGQVGLIVAVLLVLISMAGPLLSWPMTDESTYVLQARQMAEGLLPYQDFYDFVTPGSQIIGSLLIRLNGFSLLGLRLVILVGWLLELLMMYRMGKNHLPKVWLGLFLAFLWLTDSRYPIFQHHFWSGLTAMASVLMAWQYLQSLYNGNPKKGFISLSAVLCAATFWFTQSLGILLTLSLAIYSWLHCFLHEREEQGIGYRNVDNRSVFARWLKTWSVYGLLPWIAFHLVCISILLGLGLWPDFVRDTFQWIAGGHYNQTSILGYYPTFHKEFEDTIRPFLGGVPFPTILLFIFRIPIACHLFLIGALPVVGILGMGYTLPNRFHYRLLQRQDDELLLLWLCATGMIISTMSYSTSMHITSNGGIAFLLGFIVLYRFLLHKPRAEKTTRLLGNGFCGLLLLGAVTGSLTVLIWGSWVSTAPAIPEPLIYTEYRTNNRQMVALLNQLHMAESLHRSVFVFCETPALYLMGHYRNATRFALVIPQYTSPSQMAEVMQELEKNQPLYIVDDGTLAMLSRDIRFAQYTPQQLALSEIQHFIHSNYTVQGDYGRYRLYQHI